MLRILTATLLFWCTTFCSAQGVLTTFRRVLPTAPSGGPPTFIQTCDSVQWSDSSTGASCILTSVGAGDVLLIGSQGTDVTVTVNGVPLTTPLDSANSDTVRTWIYPNTSAGNNPIVVQQTSTGVTHLFVAEFSNVGPDPLDGHAVGECHGSCPYLGPITTPNLTLSGNDVVWTWCGTDYAGYGAILSTSPESSIAISHTQGTDYAEGYRVHTDPGATFSQCDQLTAGFVVAIAIKGI